MTQRKSLARKLIVLFIVLVILIPCSVLVYDTVVSSNEERVDFYYMMSDGSMGCSEKKYSPNGQGGNAEKRACDFTGGP